MTSLQFPESQQFVYDLAKSDLAYYYKQSIDGIEEAKKESWKIYNDQTVPMREKLLALKLIIQSDETRFKLLSEGPGLLAIKSLEDRLNRIERVVELQHAQSEAQGGNMFIILVPFSKYHKEMLAHYKELLEYKNGQVSIHPRFNKLITLCCSTNPVRYKTFRQAMKGFSTRTLSNRLNELEKNRIVE